MHLRTRLKLVRAVRDLLGPGAGSAEYEATLRAHVEDMSIRDVVGFVALSDRLLGYPWTKQRLFSLGLVTVPRGALRAVQEASQRHLARRAPVPPTPNLAARLHAHRSNQAAADLLLKAAAWITDTLLRVQKNCSVRCLSTAGVLDLLRCHRPDHPVMTDAPSIANSYGYAYSWTAAAISPVHVNGGLQLDIRIARVSGNAAIYQYDPYRIDAAAVRRLAEGEAGRGQELAVLDTRRGPPTVTRYDRETNRPCGRGVRRLVKRQPTERYPRWVLGPTLQDCQQQLRALKEPPQEVNTDAATPDSCDQHSS